MEELLLGIEIGGTKLQLALGTTGGELVARHKGAVDVEKGAEGIQAWLLEHIPNFTKSSAGPIGKVIAIGCGFGGPIDRHHGRVLQSNQVLGWQNFPIRDWFEDAFELPTWVENDSNAAAWGEYLKGVGVGTQHFFYTNLGSGVGGGFIFNGELYDGQGFGAGEFGHMLIPDPSGGFFGEYVEIEQICSGWSIENRLRQAGYVPASSEIFKRVQGNLAVITAMTLAEAAQAGDNFALAEIDMIARAMGIGLANVLCLTNLERIAIGGGVSKMGSLLLDPIRQYTADYVFANNQGRYQIMQSVLGDDIVLMGAVLLAKQAFVG